MIRAAALSVGLLAQPVMAQTLFDCAVAGRDARLSVTLEGGFVTYRYGPEGAPELVLTRSVDEVVYQPWPGIGRTIWEDVAFANAGVDYTVFQYFARPLESDEDLDEGAGVSVSRGDEVLVRLDCETPFVADFTAIGDALIDKGYCHAPDGWRKGAGGWSCE